MKKIPIYDAIKQKIDIDDIVSVVYIKSDTVISSVNVIRDINYTEYKVKIERLKFYEAMYNERPIDRKIDKKYVWVYANRCIKLKSYSNIDEEKLDELNNLIDIALK